MAARQAPLGLLLEELVQRRDEGCELPASLAERIAALDEETDAWDWEKVDPLYDELADLPADKEQAAREPNELEEIRALRPDGPRDLQWKPDENELFDRLHGTWTGRFVGCALGKPVEGMGMRCQKNGEIYSGRRDIKRYLQNRDDWPLRDYFSLRDAGDGLKLPEFMQSYREKIAFMEPDDDVHYTLVGLGVLEEQGPEFTWREVGKYWCGHIPVAHICTAETRALLNLLRTTDRGRGGHPSPAYTRGYRNPFREWIGAQIRADGWAYACAGKPEAAAEFAYRDACWTHERNGIYGEMMWAAIIAASFVESEPRRLVETGLSEIPADCRLARLTRQCLEWVEESDDWESCAARVEEATAGMSTVHTINNALLCVLSLFHGRMDTTKTPAIAVMCGMDTDCNGATVGSVVGAAAGRKKFGGTLADRLHDTVKPAMIGFQETTMTDLARRTAKVWHTVDEYIRKRGA